MTATQINFPVNQIIGQIRTFGFDGPAYQVLETSSQQFDGKQSLRIRVLNTGEETEYPLEQALNDPEAR